MDETGSNMAQHSSLPTSRIKSMTMIIRDQGVWISSDELTALSSRLVSQHEHEASAGHDHSALVDIGLMVTKPSLGYMACKTLEVAEAMEVYDYWSPSSSGCRGISDRHLRSSQPRQNSHGMQECAQQLSNSDPVESKASRRRHR